MKREIWANKPRLMAVCMFLAMLSMLILFFAERPWQLWFFLPLVALVEATFPVNWSTVGEFFGRASFAKIRGSMIFIQAWGAVVGPVVAGAIYDRTQSYNYLLWGLVGVLFVVGCLYALVVKPTAGRQITLVSKALARATGLYFHKDGAFTIIVASMLAILGRPHFAIVISISSRRISRTRITPCSPSTAKPQKSGRPMKTAFAPKAIAFTTSAPRRMPPSSNTSTLPWAASTTSGSTSIVANVLSRW